MDTSMAARSIQTVKRRKKQRTPQQRHRNNMRKHHVGCYTASIELLISTFIKTIDFCRNPTYPLTTQVSFISYFPIFASSSTSTFHTPRFVLSIFCYANCMWPTRVHYQIITSPSPFLTHFTILRTWQMLNIVIATSTTHRSLYIQRCNFCSSDFTLSIARRRIDRFHVHLHKTLPCTIFSNKKFHFNGFLNQKSPCLEPTVEFHTEASSILYTQLQTQ